VPECYIPPSQVLEWRALLELYHDLRVEHTGWAQHRLQVNTALSIMDTLAEHLDRLRRRLAATARHVKGARALMDAIYGVGPMTSLALCS